MLQFIRFCCKIGIFFCFKWVDVVNKEFGDWCLWFCDQIFVFFDIINIDLRDEFVVWKSLVGGFWKDEIMKGKDLFLYLVVFNFWLLVVLEFFDYVLVGQEMVGLVFIYLIWRLLQLLEL